MDTLENQVRDALEHRAEQEPTRQAPVAETMRAGRQRRNRRRAATTAVAATAAVTLTVPMLLGHQADGGPATPPVATPPPMPSPTVDGEQPSRPRLRPEEQRLIDAFAAAGIAEANVFEHGSPGDAWVAAPLPSGRTGVAHTNAAGLLTTGEPVGKAEVSGARVTMVETDALGSTAQFTCGEFSGEVALLEDFQPSGSRSDVLALTRTLLQHLGC